MNAKTVKPPANRAGLKNLTGLMIRQCREKRGWTQQQLADAFRKMGIPITRCVIANIETQRCPVTDCQIVFFARILGVSWESLVPDKTTLDKWMPRFATKRPDPISKRSHPPQTLSRKASQKQWAICEVTCKAVKLTFRG